MDTKDYLTAFFNEKEIPVQIFRIEEKNNIHYIDTNYVIETIMNTSDGEQIQIVNILRKIDCKNGSILHFLKYLAQRVVKKYEATEVKEKINN